MYSYRISKYKPILRDNNDNYTDLEEWTSFNDIGKVLRGELFTYEKYIIIENKYIETIFYFMEYLNIQTFIIKDLEIYDAENLLENVSDNNVIDKNSLKNLLKLILREKIWAKLEYNNDLKIHFGYDYYMYVITKKTSNTLLEKITGLDLYVEKFNSPYS